MIMTNEVEIVAYVPVYTLTGEDYEPLPEGFFNIILLNNAYPSDRCKRQQTFIRTFPLSNFMIKQCYIQSKMTYYYIIIPI